MCWIENFFNLEYNIKNIDEQIVYAAQTSYAISTDKALLRITNLIKRKNEMINEYVEYQSRFDKLKPKVKIVFELRYKENKPAREIAKQLDTSIRTVQRWISLAKEDCYDKCRKIGRTDKTRSNNICSR